MIVSKNLLVWFLDPATFELVGEYRDKDKGRFRFRVVIIEGGHRIIGEAMTNDGHITIDLGRILCGDSEKRAKDLCEHILGTLLKVGVQGIKESGDLQWEEHDKEPENRRLPLGMIRDCQKIGKKVTNDLSILQRIGEAVVKKYPWYAVDANGREFLHRNEPEIPNEANGWWCIQCSIDCVYLGTRDMTDIDWRETKERIV